MERDLLAAAQAVSRQAEELIDTGTGISVFDDELLDFMGAFEETALESDL